jgi:hypothetical protein
MRVVIASRVAMIPLAVLTFFALAADTIGVSLMLGAGRIAAATGGSPTGFTIVGIASAVVGVVLTIWCALEWRAIRAIDVAEDGTWTLLGYFGPRATLSPKVEVQLELVGYIFIFVRPLPKADPMVKGIVRSGDRTWRLVRHDVSSYDRALRELDLGGPAPRRARATYVRRAA